MNYEKDFDNWNLYAGRNLLGLSMLDRRQSSSLLYLTGLDNYKKIINKINE